MQASVPSRKDRPWDPRGFREPCRVVRVLNQSCAVAPDGPHHEIRRGAPVPGASGGSLRSNPGLVARSRTLRLTRGARHGSLPCVCAGRGGAPGPRHAPEGDERGGADGRLGADNSVWIVDRRRRRPHPSSRRRRGVLRSRDTAVALPRGGVVRRVGGAVRLAREPGSGACCDEARYRQGRAIHDSRGEPTPQTGDRSRAESTC